MVARRNDLHRRDFHQGEEIDEEALTKLVRAAVALNESEPEANRRSPTR